MTEQDRQHLMCALTVAIREQGRLEEAAGFRLSSAELGSWEDLLARLEAKRTCFVGEC